jgi:hypothetical protein
MTTANPDPPVDTLPLAGRDQGWGSSQPLNGAEQTYPRPLHPPAYSPHSPTTPAGSREPACGRQMGEGGVRLPLGPWALCRPKLKRPAAPEFQKTHRMRRGGVSHISKLMRPVSPHATQSRPTAGIARRRHNTARTGQPATSRARPINLWCKPRTNTDRIGATEGMRLCSPQPLVAQRQSTHYATASGAEPIQNPAKPVHHPYQSVKIAPPEPFTNKTLTPMSDRPARLFTPNAAATGAKKLRN